MTVCDWCGSMTLSLWTSNRCQMSWVRRFWLAGTSAANTHMPSGVKHPDKIGVRGCRLEDLKMHGDLPFLAEKGPTMYVPFSECEHRLQHWSQAQILNKRRDNNSVHASQMRHSGVLKRHERYCHSVLQVAEKETQPRRRPWACLCPIYLTGHDPSKG